MPSGNSYLVLTGKQSDPHTSSALLKPQCKAKSRISAKCLAALNGHEVMFERKEFIIFKQTLMQITL